MNEHAVNALKSELAMTRHAHKQTASRENNWLDNATREREVRFQLETKISGLKSAIVELGGTVEVAA